MSQKSILWVASILLLSGCGERHSPVLLTDHFAEEETLLLTELPVSSADLPSLGKIAYIEGRLVVTPYQGTRLFSLFDAANGTLLEAFGERGRSGYELLMPGSPFASGNSFGAYDMALKRIIWYDSLVGDMASSVVRPQRVLNVAPDSSTRLLMTVLPVGTDGYVLECKADKGKRFARVDSVGRVVSFFGRYPEDILAISDPNKQMQRTIMDCGFMALSGSVMVHAAHNRQELLFYDLTAGREPVLVREYDLGVPDDRENEAFFSSFDVAASESCFYVLYRGKWFSELNLKMDADKILIFDRAGEPIGILNLSVPVCHIAVTPDGGTLFAVGNDPQTAEPRMYRADLNLK